MRLVITFLLVCVLGVHSSNAQIDSNTKSVTFELEEQNTSQPTGLQMPARKQPSLTLPKDERDPRTQMDLGNTEPEKFDMTKSDGLLENNVGKTPKAFTRDKQPLPKYAKDQSLGQVKTSAVYVDVKYRDHEYVDGDRIRVFVNEDLVQANVFLSGSFSGFTLTLDEGENHIVFEALNQGESGPNTAELHVYDENGFIISAKEWNLLTGRRATIVVVKE